MQWQCVFEVVAVEPQGWLCGHLVVECLGVVGAACTGGRWRYGKFVDPGAAVVKFGGDGAMGCFYESGSWDVERFAVLLVGLNEGFAQEVAERLGILPVRQRR